MLFRLEITSYVVTGIIWCTRSFTVSFLSVQIADARSSDHTISRQLVNGIHLPTVFVSRAYDNNT